MKYLTIFMLCLFSIGVSGQYNITRNNCEIVLSESGGGDDLKTLNLNHMVFDSSSTTKAVFVDKLNKVRFSLEIADLDSITYQGALDTIVDVTTALGTATNMLTLITQVENWQAQCEMNSFDVQRIYFGSGTPEGSVTAPLGALYINTAGGAGTTIYAKESGDWTNTGWSGL